MVCKWHYMAILERAAVTPTKPKFYTRFVDGVSFIERENTNQMTFIIKSTIFIATSC